VTDRYRQAGVDLDAAEAAKRRIVASITSTRTDLARGLVGAFGGTCCACPRTSPIPFS